MDEVMTAKSPPTAGSPLARLTKGRWYLHLIAGIGDKGERSAVLLGRLGLSRSMLSRSLGRLQQEGWIMPNPGHGHPLRPEWKLTPQGLDVLPHVEALIAAQEAVGAGPDSAGRWHLPLLAALLNGEMSFSALESALAPISPRALSQALKHAIALDHVLRRVDNSFPPTPFYRLSKKAREMADEARRLSLS